MLRLVFWSVQYWVCESRLSRAGVGDKNMGMKTGKTEDAIWEVWAALAVSVGTVSRGRGSWDQSVCLDRSDPRRHMHTPH